MFSHTLPKADSAVFFSNPSRLPSFNPILPSPSSSCTSGPVTVLAPVAPAIVLKRLPNCNAFDTVSNAMLTPNLVFIAFVARLSIFCKSSPVGSSPYVSLCWLISSSLTKLYPFLDSTPDSVIAELTTPVPTLKPVVAFAAAANSARFYTLRI